MCKPTWHRAIVGLIEEIKMVKMIDYIRLKMKKKRKKTNDKIVMTHDESKKCKNQPERHNLHHGYIFVQIIRTFNYFGLGQIPTRLKSNILPAQVEGEPTFNQATLLCMSCQASLLLSLEMDMA